MYIESSSLKSRAITLLKVIVLRFSSKWMSVKSLTIAKLGDPMEEVVQCGLSFWAIGHRLTKHSRS